MPTRWLPLTFVWDCCNWYNCVASVLCSSLRKAHSLLQASNSSNSLRGQMSLSIQSDYQTTLHKKWSFPLRISSVNVTLMENFVFCAKLRVLSLFGTLRFCTTKNNVDFFLTEMLSLKFGSNVAFITTNLLWLLSGRNDFCFTKYCLE